jgi:hypothetical protein
MDEFDELFELAYSKPIPIKDIQCCNNYDKIYMNDIATCSNCGCINMDDRLPYVNRYDNNLNWRPPQPYKRAIYMRQKLAMIGCLKSYPLSPKLLFFINQFKSKKFRSLYRLKKLMKSHKLNSYYKHIYSVYYAITGKCIIRLNYDDVNHLIASFIRLERAFNDKNVKRNLYSYNVIIYYLLKIHNIRNYQKMILPMNKNKIRRKIEELFKISGIHLT